MYLTYNLKQSKINLKLKYNTDQNLIIIIFRFEQNYNNIIGVLKILKIIIITILYV